MGGFWPVDDCYFHPWGMYVLRAQLISHIPKAQGPVPGHEVFDYIQALHYQKYSTASDVWSFGALMYEIWSVGHKPFEGVANVKVNNFSCNS